MKKYFNDKFKHFLYGGDYNPEQWTDTKEIWDEDMRLFKLANCNEMTVGIFSWSVLEPKEDEYDFSFLDEILTKIYKTGGRVILATPSGSRPRWMANKHEEVLRVDNRGQRNPFGRRHNHCPTSPYYRKKVYEIDSMLAKRYADHPAVIGWHISNELQGECFCPLCRKEFSKWLQKKYKTIDKLNFQWWTAFWSHTYDDFDSVEPPLPNGDTFSALQLDWKRFITDKTADFVNNEVNAIRQYSDLPVTVNMMAPFTGLNYNVLAKSVDVISWDNYPLWHGIGKDGKYNDRDVAIGVAMSHDAFRCLKQRPFLLMESTPSNTNWQAISKLKRPGMNVLSSMQAVAHGSDSVLYFQWRKSRGSNEKFHGAVVDHCGHENTRVFREVSELGKKLKKLDSILGTMPSSKVALIVDMENSWAIKEAQGFQNGDKKYYETCRSFYEQLWSRAIDVDVISMGKPLSQYDLVIAPMLYITSDETVDKIEEYVKNGGTFLTTYMFGMVNENDLCHLGGFPAGKLKDIFGLWAEEIDTLYPEERNYIISNGKEYEVADYCERIHANDDSEIIATYKNDFYADEPAVIKNKYGKGCTYYLAARDTGAFKSCLLSEILKELKIYGNINNVPYGVTAHKRADENNSYLFVENYNNYDVEVDIGGEKYEMLEGRNEKGIVKLPPFSVRIYSLK